MLSPRGPTSSRPSNGRFAAPGRSGRAPILQGWNASSRRSSSSTSSARRSSSRAPIPEVVRSRLTRFFDQVTHCITTHGGIVQKFAGDAVMAAFGVPVRARGRPGAGGARRARDRRGGRQARPRGADRDRVGRDPLGRDRDDVRDRPRDQRRGAPAAGCAAGRDHARPDRRAPHPPHRRHDAARRPGGARLPRRGRGLACRLGRRRRRPPARRLGAARRARGGDRAAPQHVRARRQGQPRAPRHRLRRRRASASRASRGSSSTASSARRSSPAAACPTARASRTGPSPRW